MKRAQCGAKAPTGPRKARPSPAVRLLRAIFFFQERDDDSDSLPRLFLHDPVAGIADDRTANVGGGKADFRCQPAAIGMVATDGKHWKRQLAFAHQRLIVDRVLGKRRKLSAESIVNGTGPGV
jgi:hypothetical protein